MRDGAMSVLTPPQVARRWHAKPETVRRLLESGVLRGFSVSAPGTKRPRWRVTLAAVVAYEAGETAPATIAEKPHRRRKRTAVPTGPF
jgi:hypothetical protein